MFFIFGRKGRAAKSYEAPAYPIVVEPFAGSMAYSLVHRPQIAIGVEKDRQTYDLWHRLCSMTAEEIQDFPCPEIGERTTDGWVLQAGVSNSSVSAHSRKVNDFIRVTFEKQRRMALKHHEYASRSVVYLHGDYRDAPDIEATWFIDPPYERVKTGYRHGSAEIDYDELAKWCTTRKGQVIMCEGFDGSWLPFEHHGSRRGMPTFEQQGQRPIVEKVLVIRTHARCQQCGTTFPASRSDAKFCSGKCRTRAQRAGKT